MATAPSPNDLTRQQLDELDALLQKMLAVPLTPTEPSPPAAPPAMPQAPLPPTWRMDPSALAPSLSHLAVSEPSPPTLKFEPPVPAPAPAPAPVAKVPKPAPVTISVPAPAPKPPTPTVVAPKVAPAPVPRPVVAPAPQPKTPTAFVPAAPAASPVPLVAVPFVAVNGLFNSACEMFGAPGRLLCSGLFKQMYGFVGLGLLVYTALHVAQVQGWVSLPVLLPWPK